MPWHVPNLLLGRCSDLQNLNSYVPSSSQLIMPHVLCCARHILFELNSIFGPLTPPLSPKVFLPSNPFLSCLLPAFPGHPSVSTTTVCHLVLFSQLRCWVLKEMIAQFGPVLKRHRGLSAKVTISAALILHISHTRPTSDVPQSSQPPCLRCLLHQRTQSPQHQNHISSCSPPITWGFRKKSQRQALT